MSARRVWPIAAPAAALALVSCGLWLLYRPPQPPSQSVSLNTQIVQDVAFAVNGVHIGPEPVRVTAGERCHLTGQFLADLDFWNYRIPGQKRAKRPTDDPLARPNLSLQLQIVRRVLFRGDGSQEVVGRIITTTWRPDGTVDCELDLVTRIEPGLYEARIAIHQRPQGFPGEHYPIHYIATFLIEVVPADG